MKNLRLILLAIAITIGFASCEEKDDNEPSETTLPGNATGNTGGNSIFGVWQRYNSPKGYKTDLAVGNIPGEPSNRVYMCEHPGSPSAGLYKGYISGNIITWDASHRLPNAEFKEVGSERTLYFGVGAVADAGKYKKGIWTNTCGELKYTPKNVYYRWTNGSNCPMPSRYSFTYNYPDLPGNLTKNQLYGPIAAGNVEINFGTGTPLASTTLTAPAEGYKRIYTHTIFQFNNSVNRCIFYLNGDAGLTYV